MKINWLTIIGYPVSLIFLASVVLITFWLVFPYKTTEFEEIKLLTPEIKAGENLRYSVTRCKYTDKPAVISKRIIDGTVFNFPDKHSDTKSGCVKDAVVTMNIPEYTPEGKYTLEVLMFYQVNPIREIKTGFIVDSFIITN